ncbi:MAG: DUF2090 domain-containing protein [Bradyrhizobium sp.]
MLAFDQRNSFKKGLFGIDGMPSAAQIAKIADCKLAIFEGLQLAVSDGVRLSSAGLLVDEEFGAEVARAAKAEGYTLAMAVEESGRTDFDFEYGAAFAEHIEAFDPDYAKVLVRYNPDGDRALNTAQLARLARLSKWLRGQGRRLLFELLVPAEPAQLEKVYGDLDRYDREVRPGLTVEAMAELQAAGIEPDIWKIEGMDRRKDYARAYEQARAGGRDQVACIVLGRGATQAQVGDWLRQEAGVTGFIGFAVGRTIWQQPLEDWLARKVDRSAAVRLIADSYVHFVRVFESARVSPVADTDAETKR